MKKNNIFVKWRDRGLFMALRSIGCEAGSNPVGLSFSLYNSQTLIA